MIVASAALLTTMMTPIYLPATVSNTVTRGVIPIGRNNPELLTEAVLVRVVDQKAPPVGLERLQKMPGKTRFSENVGQGVGQSDAAFALIATHFDALTPAERRTLKALAERVRKRLASE